jgi:hypothetical protein
MGIFVKIQEVSVISIVYFSFVFFANVSGSRHLITVVTKIRPSVADDVWTVRVRLEGKQVWKHASSLDLTHYYYTF